MSNEVATKQDSEIENLRTAARQDTVDRRLKFVKGEYLFNKELIPLGTQYLAHPKSWTKEWIKFLDDKVADRKQYSVVKGEKPPERDELDDLDPKSWPEGIDGKPSDPWQLQYLLPLENLQSGEVLIFTTPSTGGHVAVAELVDLYARRANQIANCGQPIIELATTHMKTRAWGKVLRPDFKIVAWDDPAHSLPLDDIPPAQSEDDFEEIPFFNDDK